jgi:hypothetical protein
MRKYKPAEKYKAEFQKDVRDIFLGACIVVVFFAVGVVNFLNNCLEDLYED